MTMDVYLFYWAQHRSFYQVCAMLSQNTDEIRISAHKKLNCIECGDDFETKKALMQNPFVVRSAKKFLTKAGHWKNT